MNSLIKKQKPEKESISFDDSKKWNVWLNKNHSKSNGIWLRFYKKDSGIKSISHEQALDEALCFGWIDGQAVKFDYQSWLQKFTPRRERSLWSKRNAERCEKLIELKKMKPSGLKEINKAKEDGRWRNAYDSSGNMTIPDDFLKELSKNKATLKFFDSLNKTNKYAISWRLQTAVKPETRKKRITLILEMLSKGEKFH